MTDFSGSSTPLRTRSWFAEERPLLHLITVFVFLLLLGFWQWGFPAAGWIAAKLTPAPVASALDERTLHALDGKFFEPSQLSSERQEQITQAFMKILQQAKIKDVQPRILFRHAVSAPQSAFALPGGTIIVTDTLIDATQNDGELLGVLAHELALIATGEPLRIFFTSLAWPTLSYIVTRNTSSVFEAAETEASLNLHPVYPARLRGETDTRAVDLLLAVGENPTAFADLHERISTAINGQMRLAAANLIDVERLSAIRAYAARRATH